MVRDWEGFIKDSMHRLNSFEVDKLKGDNEIIVHDGKEYGTYADGYHLMAKKVWKDIQEFDTRDGYVKQTPGRVLHKHVADFN